MFVCSVSFASWAVLIAVSRFHRVVRQWLVALHDSIRDEQFLVGRELVNAQHEAAPVAAPPTPLAAAPPTPLVAAAPPPQQADLQPVPAVEPRNLFQLLQAQHGRLPAGRVYVPAMVLRHLPVNPVQPLLTQEFQ